MDGTQRDLVTAHGTRRKDKQHKENMRYSYWSV
jgi:hypothetical protein